MKLSFVRSRERFSANFEERQRPLGGVYFRGYYGFAKQMRLKMPYITKYDQHVCAGYAIFSAAKWHP